MKNIIRTLTLILAFAAILSAAALGPRVFAASEDAAGENAEGWDPLSVAAAIIAVLGVMVLCGSFIIRRR